MLHILLLILKIIGIIIAVILGILVLLICIVLFVPVRYEVKALCDGTLEGIRARAKVTWLLHLIKVTASYENQRFSWHARIAWKNIQSGQDKTQAVKEEVEGYEEELEQLLEEDAKRDSAEPEKKTKEKSEERVEKYVESSQNPLEEIEKEPEIFKRDAEEIQTDKETVEEAETCADQGRKESDYDSQKERKNIWWKIKSFFQKITRKIRDIYLKITIFRHKFKCTIQSICDKIKALSEKKDKICGFLTDEVHKKAFLKAKKEVFCLLRKLKPKCLKADIHYGFEDSYRTGQLLAGFSVLYPFLGDDVHIRPDFENKVLDGKVYVKGRIRISFFAKLLWSLVWCREVRMTYQHIKKFEL